MKLILSCVWPLALKLFLLIAVCSTLSDCFDPLDPNGNITVTFDILDYTDNAYVARVTIQNYYQYRHVDSPGWSLGWTWTMREIILSISGAFATENGDCSEFRLINPYSCVPSPVFGDLAPEALPESRSEGCCHGGLLSAWAIDPSKSFSSFDISVGNLGKDATGNPPANLTLLAPGPGYTCGPVLETEPTKSLDIGGKRRNQVYKTWKSSCTYSSFVANKIPACCVSLSTFYNPEVTACPNCSCGCRGAEPSTLSCIREGDSTSRLDATNADIVQCTDHMCPVRIHWHIKNNYIDYWRVKLTVSNYNYRRNYSNWNVLVQHPGFSQKALTYSFNQTVLPTVGFEEKAALFWGFLGYNDELIQADHLQLGSATTDIIIEKDLNAFTLSNGWALPRRIYFNGEECQMPLPDTFPMLPNGSSKITRYTFLLILVSLIFQTLIAWL